jgi:von Willebrand factor type A domain
LTKALCTAVLAACFVIPVFLAPPAAGAAISARTDVMFLFDTTGSMNPVLEEARTQIRATIERVDSQVSDVQYGVAELADYGGSVYAEKEPDIVPWRLRREITANRTDVINSIGDLQVGGGGDRPESYGRAIWETRTNPTVGWRDGSRRLIVLVADSVPHDDNLNEGIPQDVWVSPSPWTTGEELLEPARVSGTVLGPGTVLDWQNVLQQLAAASTPLEVIAYASEYLPYWEDWAARTSGGAMLGSKGQLGDDLVDLVVAGTQGPCRRAQGGTGKMLLAALKCRKALPALKEKCGRRLSKGRTEYTPPAGLLSQIRAAKFLRRAPARFGDPDAALDRLRSVRTALDLLRTLPGFAEAVRRAHFERIARAIAAVPGAKGCAAGLILAVK